MKNALQLSQLVVPHMQHRKEGAIVYISSIAGFQPIDVSIFPSVIEDEIRGSQIFYQSVSDTSCMLSCVIEHSI